MEQYERKLFNYSHVVLEAYLSIIFNVSDYIFARHILFRINNSFILSFYCIHSLNVH